MKTEIDEQNTTSSNLSSSLKYILIKTKLKIYFENGERNTTSSNPSSLRTSTILD